MPNQLVQWWRDTRPEDASLSDEDITVKIANVAPDYKLQGRDIFAEYPDFASDYDSILKGSASEYRKSTATLSGEVGRGLQRGLSGLKSTAYGAAALAADAIPGTFADPARDAMLRKYKVAQEEASQEDVAPAVSSYKGVDDLRSAGQYIAGLAGEGLPSVAESVLTGAAGALAGSEVPVAGNIAGGIAGIVGKQAAKRLIAKKIAGYTAQEIEEAAIRGVGSEALKQLVRAETKAITSTAGALLANTLNSYGLSAGEIYGDLATNPNVKPEDALGIAVTAAIPAAIADTALPGYLINKSGVLRRLAGQIENFGETEKRGFFGYIARLAAEVPKVSTMEAGTEAFQELVNIAAAKYGETGKLDLSLTEADKERIINAGLAGAVAATTTAPMAAARFDKQAAEPVTPAPTPEAAAAVPVDQQAPAAPVASVIEPVPAESAADVLEAGYDTNIEGIKDLAQRKIAGDDVSAEEAALKPDAARRYQREVIAASEAKVATEAAAPTEVTAETAKAAQTQEQLIAPETRVPDYPADVITARPDHYYRSIQTPDDLSGTRHMDLGRIWPDSFVIEMSPDQAATNTGANDTFRGKVRPENVTRIIYDNRAYQDYPSDYIQDLRSQFPNAEFIDAVLNDQEDGYIVIRKTPPTNANQEPSPVEVPSGEGAQAAAQVAEGGATPVQEAPSKVESEDAQQSLIKNLDTLSKRISTTQSGIDSLESKSRDAIAKMEEAKALLSEYDAADKDTQKKLDDRVNKYGGRDKLVEFISEVQVIERNAAGKPTITLTGRKDGRGSVASKLNSLKKQLDDLNSKFSGLSQNTTQDIGPGDVNLDVRNLQSQEPIQQVAQQSGELSPQDIAEGGRETLTSQLEDEPSSELEVTGSDGEVFTVPGFFDAAEDTEASNQMNWFTEDFLSSDDQAKKDSSVEKLGELLTAGARSDAGGNSESKRMTAWVGKDGSIILSTSHKRIKSKAEGKTSANSKYRFAVESGKGTAGGNTSGIVDMLNAGYTPYASILLKASRPTFYQKIESIDAFNSKFADAKIERDRVGDVSNTAVMQDEQSTVVDTNQKSPSALVEESEAEPARLIMDHLISQAESIASADGTSMEQMLRSGQFESFLEKTLIGRMISTYETIISSDNDVSLSSNFINTFAEDISKIAGAIKMKMTPSEVNRVIEVLPGLIAPYHYGMARRNAFEALRKSKQSTNEKNRATREAAASADAREAAVATVDGGADGKGDSQVAQEGTEAVKAEAGTPTAGKAVKARAADAGPDVAVLERAELVSARSATESKVDALESIAAISSEIADQLRTAIGISDKAGLVQLGLEIANIQEASINASRARRENKARQLKSLDELRDSGLIDEESADNLSSEINAARSPDEQAKIDESLAKIEEKKDQTRSKMSQSDPDAIESVDLANGTITPPDLIPSSIENIQQNIASKARPANRILESKMDADIIKMRYVDLKTSLRKIAMEGAMESNAMGVIRATVARSMMDKLLQSGVSIEFVSQTELPSLLGKYDLQKNLITIYVDSHSNESELDGTILEEALHAFTSRSRIAADVAPETLSSNQAEAIAGLNSLIESAKKAGLTWQQSDSSDSAVVFDEFIAAVVRDKEFQDQLSGIPFEKDFVIKKATNLFQAIKLQIAKLIESIVSKYPIFGSDGKVDGMTAMDASFVFVNALIANHQKVSADIASQAKTNVRFRHVKGTLGTGAEITVDDSQFASNAKSEAKRLMALQNLIQDAMTRMVDLWQSKGNNRSSQGAQLLSNEEAIKSLIVGVISDSMPMPSEAKQAINDALSNQGASTISDTITMGDLEQKSDATKVARDGLNALNTVLFNLKRMRSEAEELFGKKNILQKIADSSFEISELTKKFEDMNFIGKEFVKELRRSINESEDVGAGSIAKAMGLATGRKAALQSAANWIQSNLDTYTDALVALSELGVDFKNTPPADILKAVKAAAATDARLVPMQDIGRLAMAGQFARRRPMVMDFLATRSSGEAGALRSIVAMATSSRADAIEMAKRDLPKLKRIGGIAARIIDKLSEMKAQHRKMLDQAKLHAEREQFAIDAESALVERIKYLERMLQVEDAAGNKQWQPHHNATYFVPSTPNQSEDSLFDANPNSPSYRKLLFGSEFDGAKVRSELALMKGWLDANQNLIGTSKYNLMKRQIDGLTKVYAEEVDANVRRGPFGFLVRALGSSADRLEQLGLLSAKEAATMIRRYVSSFEQSLKSVDAKSFHEFDALMRKGVELSGLHPKEFKRQYYNRALGYLETRQDLLDPKLSPQVQEEVLIREAIGYMDKSTPMAESLKQAVRDILRTAGRNGEIIIGRNRVNFGLKVADVMKDGRVYLREPIGHPLSTAARSLHEDTRVLANKMAKVWKESFTVGGVTENSLKASSVSNLYTNNINELRKILSTRFTDEVIAQFVKPLINKTGKTNFNGPTKLGVVDLAKREYLIEAFRLSGGDIIRFAEELNKLEGGDPSTIADFVGETVAAFQGYASTLFTVANTAGSNLDEDSDPGLNFLNARQGEDFPWEWLDFKEYGYKNRTRYIRVMAQQFAFGDGQDGFSKAIEETRRQLTQLKSEYDKAHTLLISGDRAGYERVMNEGGNRIARQNAAANRIELDAAEKRHKALMSEINGGNQSAGVFSEILGVISGMTVQGFGTAAVDSITLFEAPLRKFGFSKEAIKFIGGTWSAVGTEIAGTLAQTLGMQFHQDIATKRETEILNNNGLADNDSITGLRGFKALHERYIQELAEELTFSAITDRYQNERITMAKELAAGAVKRVAKAGKVFLEAGIGQAKDPNQAFATLKLLNPFTQASIWMHRAVARQWLRTINNSILKAEIYFQSHPAAAADPNFQFTSKELGYSGKTLTGMKLDNRSWEYLKEKLAQSGISLEDSARKKMRGQDPLDFNQIQSALGLAQTEILLNTSPVTRPAWSQDTLAGRLSTPLIGWALYKTADVAKSATGPKSKGDLKAFISFMEAMMLGVLPISLAYAFLRDEYEEEVLKKKQNVMPLRLDATLPAAMLDATSRLGMLGIIGEIPNSIVNQSTQREVSIDSRVFAVSSALNLMKTMSTLYNQGGTVTFQSVVRPMMQSFGGSGYLQNFDAINGLTGMDNVESRLAKRINAGNQLRVAGRINGLEIRSGKGMVTTSNPVKPHVVNMALSAYANDARSFRESYQKALQAAKKAYPDSDPYEKVASAFESQHPLKSVFASRPSSADYQKMLRSMGDDAAEVSTAIRNLNAYGSQVLTKRGGSGIKPFYGTETTKRSTDYRTMLTR